MKGHRKHSKQGSFPLGVLGAVVFLLGSMLSLSSCWHPPFDPRVSAALISSQKLGSPLMELRTCLPYDTQGGYYLPSRNDINQGFWIKKDFGRLRVYSFFVIDSDTANISGFHEMPLSNGGRILSLPSFPNSSALFFTLSNMDRWFNIDMNLEISASTPVLNGIGGGYRWDTDKDILFIAYIENESLKLSVNSDPLADINNFNSASTSYELPADLAGDPLMGINFVVQSPTDELYLSGYLSDGTAVTYYWAAPNNSPPVRLPMNRPMTELLSDGRLVSDTGDRLYLYDEQGNELGSIATGDLHFSYEWYDSGQNQWMSRFTRTILIGPCPSKKGSWEYLISVYGIPTKDLSRLQL